MVLFGETFIAFGGEVIIVFFGFYFFLRKWHTAKIPISYLVQMVVVVNRFLLRKKFTGICLWPFIIIRKKTLKNDHVFMNHERIHLRQQAEMLVLPFYLWYGVEFLFRLFQYKNKYEAYRNISFEREAYKNDKDLLYLKGRPFWRFLNYLWNLTWF